MKLVSLQAATKNQHSNPAAASGSSGPDNNGAMSLCVLDVSRAISEHRVRWIPPKSEAPCPGGSPEEAVLYSIVHGHGELIVFGGVQKFMSTVAPSNAPANGGPNIVSNNVYFIKPPKTII